MSAIKLSYQLKGAMLGYAEFLAKSVPGEKDGVKKFLSSGGERLLFEIQNNIVTPAVLARCGLEESGAEVGRVSLDQLSELLLNVKNLFGVVRRDWSLLSDAQELIGADENLQRVLHIYLGFDCALTEFLKRKERRQNPPIRVSGTILARRLNKQIVEEFDLTEQLVRFWGSVSEFDDPVTAVIEVLTFQNSYCTFELKADPNVHLCVQLLQSQQHEKLKAEATRLLREFPEHTEYIKFLGIACACLGEALKAREYFLKALEANHYSSENILNYVSACLQDCVAESTIQTLDLYFDYLAPDAYEQLAESLSEAIEREVLKFDQLPKKVRNKFNSSN